MPVTFKEWDAAIKQHSLHLKYDSQLFYLEESIEAKIPRVARDLFEHRMFPDAIKREIYLSLAESGEITPEPLTAVKLSPTNQLIVDSEYLSRLTFYQNKVTWLKEKLTYCKKEMELRADRLVVRKPKGTTYYVDFTNGHDVNNDGSTAVKTNGDGPWATLDKATATLTAGDTAIVRRAMTQVVTQDLAFANDGTAASPIILEADYGDAWGDFVDLSGTGTATLVWGSKTVTFSADISGVLAAGDWIYASGDVSRDYAYEVKTVAVAVVTLYLPYKGGQAGAGKTMYNMQDAPIWNTAAGNFEVNIDADHFWRIQGIHFRGTDSMGVIELDSVKQVILKDLILTGNHSGVDFCIYVSDEVPYALIHKCRGYDCSFLRIPAGWASLAGEVRDCFYDGNGAAGACYIWTLGQNDSFVGIDTEIVGAVHLVDITATTMGHYIERFRNCPFTVSGNVVDGTVNIGQGIVFFEDYDGTLGDNRQFGLLSTDDDTQFLQSDAAKVRGGGGATSIKVTPGNALINDNYEISKVKLFEYPIYAVKDVAKTYTIYLASDDDTDWTANPLNTELWIEADYWGHATAVYRRILKSTEVCGNFKIDDTVWDTLTVTVTPLQTGICYLRGYYCKPKEAGNLNIFNCDTKVVIS